MVEVLAAAERRRNNSYDCLEDGNPWQMDQDAGLLADAALAAGMFQADDGERITTIEHAVACGGERHSGSYRYMVLFHAGSLCITWDSQADWWQLGNDRLWRDYSPTRGQLRQLLKSIGGGDGK